MSRFDMPGESKHERKAQEKGVTVDGTFYCQTCGEECEDAIYYPVGDLVWKCPEGHVSIIEDFG